MIIHDVTSLIQQNIDNYYCLNNSLMHLKDNFFISTYRVIKYNIPDGSKLHPWKIWNDGNKIFAKNTKFESLLKYRPKFKI